MQLPSWELFLHAFPSWQTEVHLAGSQAAVAQVVEMFYQKLTGDPFISHFFAGIGMERLNAKQVSHTSHCTYL